MDSELASGDNIESSTPPKSPKIDESKQDKDVTPQTIEENEIKLQERIAHCKTVVASLRQQLTEEKEKQKSEKKLQPVEPAKLYVSGCHYGNLDEFGNSSMYSACVDSKLYCDESLIEYEKQLQRYQNTLNMVQNEKKNAIRRKMIAKAFKLKLLEIENQCKIELLRVKQSLACLEPLQMIVNKWKTDPEENLYDINNLDLMPGFLELKAHSGPDVNSYKDFDINEIKESCNTSKDDSMSM